MITNPDQVKTKTIDLYPKAAWRNWGSLNAGRCSVMSLDKCLNLANNCSELPMTELYPVMSWVIENCLRKYRTIGKGNQYIRPMFESLTVIAELIIQLSTYSNSQLAKIKNSRLGSKSLSSIVIEPGQRSMAIDFIVKWLEDIQPKYIKICDQYFHCDDLDLIKLIQQHVPDCSITILTSKQAQNKERIREPYDTTYSTYWNMRVSDQAPPPDTEIIIIGTVASGESPIHDRWWVTSDSGLRFGTSFNSLGITKTSDISIMSPEESVMRETTLNKYLDRSKRDHNGVLLKYVRFSL